MSRPVLFLAASLVFAGVTAADAKPTTTAGAHTAHQKSKKAKRGKRGKAAKRDSRVVTKSTKANMPRGFTWPPSRNMVAMGDACQQSLDDAGVSYVTEKPVGRVVKPMALGDATIGGVTFTAVYGKHQVFDCQLVLALANFAPRLQELGVREVKFGSAYRWSKVRVGGRTKNILSRHGLGIALDIVSFIDESGHEAVVAKDYKRGDELLLSVERMVNDSGAFRLLLTPRNDPKSHKDHFHLEANPDYTEPRTSEKPAS